MTGRFSRTAVMAAVVTCCVAMPSPLVAGGNPFAPDLVWSIGETPVVAALSDPDDRASEEPLTIELFAQELLAFTLKESFSDAGDEYAGSERIPARLSYDFRGPRNPFGEHCLQFANRVRLQLADTLGLASGARRGTTVADGVSRLVTAGIVVQTVWRGLRNEIVDRRQGFSLRPKIGSRKVALNLTFRW